MWCCSSLTQLAVDVLDGPHVQAPGGLDGYQELGVLVAIRLCGQDITHAPIRERSKLGMSHIPEDRHKHGLVLDYTLEDNLVLQRYFEPEFVSGTGFLKRRSRRCRRSPPGGPGR